MPTLYIVLDESDIEWNMSTLKAGAYAQLHIKNFAFSDQELNDYAQAIAMLLLSAKQGAALEKTEPQLTDEAEAAERLDK